MGYKSKIKKRNLVLLLTILIQFLNASFIPADANWYNGSWTYRKKISIPEANVTGDLVNFPVLLDLSDLGSSFFTNVKSDGSDIVITSSDEVTKLDRELEFIDTNNGQGILWFRAPKLFNSSNGDFYIYYGNASASETNQASTWTSAGYRLVSHLNETPTGAGGEIIDSAGFHNGTANGAPGAETSVNGKFLNGIEFDGLNGLVSYGSFTEFPVGTSKLTMSTWFKRTGSSGIAILNFDSCMYIYDSGTSGAFNETFYRRDSAGMYSGYTWGTTPVLYESWRNYLHATANNEDWHYVVGVYNGNDATPAPGRFNFYMDGKLYQPYNNNGPFASGTAQGAPLFFLGYRYDREDNGGTWSHYYMHSGVTADETRVNNRALSTSWVAAEYLNQNDASDFYTIGSQETTSTDNTSPTIIELSPPDDSTFTKLNPDLIIEFSEAIDTQNGNLYIKKSSDDSTIETINLKSSGLVEGNGNNALYIDPSSSLDKDTSYYIQIDNGAIKDVTGNNYAGINDKTTWNFNTYSNGEGWFDNNWPYRVKVTIPAANVNGTIADYVVYTRLNDMPDHFFNHVRRYGNGIRVTKQDGFSQLARETIIIDHNNTNGEMYFLTDQISDTQDNVFYIYYGNTTVAAPDNFSEYGNYNTWGRDYRGVWHFQDTYESPYNLYGRYEHTGYQHRITGLYPKGTSYGAGYIYNGGYLGGNMGRQTGTHHLGGYFTSDESISFLSPNFNFESWMKLDNTDQANVYLYSCDYKIRLLTTGTMQLIYSSYNQTNTTQADFSDMQNGTWHHVAVKHDFVNGSTAFYLDGVKKGATWTQGSGTNSNLYSQSYCTVDGDYSGGTESFTGYFDTMRVSANSRNDGYFYTRYRNESNTANFYTISTIPESINVQHKSFYPADNSTNVLDDSNLVIEFDREVDLQTGNIVIKKTSDDSIHETISVTSHQVTGNGTDMITINPSIDFSPTTSYYVEIDSGVLNDPELTAPSYAGISDKTTWNFTTNNNAFQTCFAAWYDEDWNRRLRLTIDSTKVVSDLDKFNIFVDLKILPDEFFSNVASNGSDIRITKADGTILPREVVNIDTTNKTGELHFLSNGTLSSSTDTNFFIYYDNSGASEPAAGDANGSRAVWSGNNTEIVWHMNEDPSSSNINDSAYGHDLTPSYFESSDLVEGKMGKAIDFDGVDERMDGSAPSEMHNTNGMTLNSWVKTLSGGVIVMMDSNNASAGRKFQTSMSYGSGRPSYLSFTCKTGCNPGAMYERLHALSSINDDKWHMFSAVHDNGDKMEKIYIDGILDSSNGVTAGYWLARTSSVDIDYGYSSGSCGPSCNPTGGFFSGLRDETTLSSVPRSADWLRTQYYNQSNVGSFMGVGNDVLLSACNGALQLNEIRPQNGRHNVLTNTDLRLTFNKMVFKDNGNLSIFQQNGSLVEAIDITSGQITGWGSPTIIVDPTNDLQYNSHYYVRVDSTTIKDAISNYYSGISDNGSWAFRTRKNQSSEYDQVCPP